MFIFVQRNIFYCGAPNTVLYRATRAQVRNVNGIRPMGIRHMAGFVRRATRPSEHCERTAQQQGPIKDRVMPEATTATPPKSKSKPAANPFEMPKFEIPKFEIPQVEMPAAFREFAERGVAQARDTYEKMKAAAEEATDVLETTYSTASKGAADYG